MVGNWLAIIRGLGPLDAGWATLIAGMLALCAGVLAYKAALKTYKGALETLDFERSRARKADDERRVNLYLKAEHMARNLTEISQLSLLAAQLEFSKIIDGRPVKGTRSSDDLTVKRPEQLSELWNNLSDFVSAPGAINEIRDITRNFDAAEAYLARVKEVPDSGESPLAGYYGAIKDSAFVLGEIMSSFTKTYSKEVDGRGEMLYGTPDEFDPHEFDDPKP